VRREAEDGSFGRVRDSISTCAGGKRVGLKEARARFSDALRLAARLRRLEERLGKKGVAELSPYLESLLRMARASRVIRPAELRQAAGF